MYNSLQINWPIFGLDPAELLVVGTVVGMLVFSLIRLLFLDKR